MRIALPELSFVVLIGPSGCGKSTFARRHFKATEILSSDVYRGLVSDDENDQAATEDAFDALYYVARKRLAAGRLTVLDATNVQPESRKRAVAVAREYHMLPVAIVFDLPERVCHERNAVRPDRQFGPHVVRTQRQQMHRGMRDLQREGFRQVYRLNTVEDLDAATVVREPLWNNRKSDTGPFDVIGDVHGCAVELNALLDRLGYTGTPRRHADGRKVVFLGDLVDRGPGIVEVLRTAMSMVRAGTALCVPGNHEMKLLRKLRGKNVRLTHGIAQTLEQLEREPPELAGEVAAFIDDLVSHYVLDGGRLVVAHAGMKAELQGRGSGAVREFALYGETTGETDEYGLPVRYPWASEYRGRATVVYGHTPVPEAEWLNNTICIDTGCVYGGKLTALRWPERELVQVPAKQVYCEPAKPLVPPGAEGLTAQQQVDDVLDLADVMGKRIIETRLHRTVTVREENASAALEVMSRFAVDPRWLVYLPPTMSPVETSRREGYLEYPEEAFEYFRRQGVARVVCEEKHMGSRAVVVVCRSAEVARTRFGVTSGEQGVIYTRTGRRFFTDETLESVLMGRLLAALESSDFWSEHRTNWAVLDAELMPWSLKAESLLKGQYAAVGAASEASFSTLRALLSEARNRGLDLGELPAEVSARASLARQYVGAYGRYCWPVRSVEDVKLAPFHLLATEGAVNVDKNHAWHMQALSKICAADAQVLLATPYKLVDLSEPLGVLEATRWWEDLTRTGGEGMVVKPFDFIARSERGLVQPAVKVRGPEYLRIIYGPEYTLAENLERLRNRGLGHKRSLALREFALGIEALERFIRREALRRVHECVFGVLALESEAVDPRL
jgi:polynucleotide kinase-phosphatase